MSKLIRKLNDSMCDGNIMLEPRLQEYLKKKEYFKRNNIETSISIEQEFMITPDDKEKISMFLHGNKKIYNPKYNILNKEPTEMEQQYFPSKEFRDSDDRQKRIKIKKEKLIRPVNRGMFAPDVDNLFYDEPPVDAEPILSGRDLSSTYQLDVPKQFNSSRTYDYKPKPGQNYRLHNEPLIPFKHCYEIDPGTYDNTNMISELKKYSKTLRSHDKHEELNMKRAKPPRTEREKQLTLGMPSHTTKSYGYENPAEHYFDYIDPTIQDSRNLVFSDMPRGGFSTRADNREGVRQIRNR